MLAADDLAREDYDALRRQQVIDVPYQGRLYTEQEIVTGAWLQDRSAHPHPSPRDTALVCRSLFLMYAVLTDTRVVQRCEQHTPQRGVQPTAAPLLASQRL